MKTRYVKCIAYRATFEEYIVGKVYPIENNGVRTEQGFLGKMILKPDLKNHYSNADFAYVGIFKQFKLFK